MWHRTTALIIGAILSAGTIFVGQPTVHASPPRSLLTDSKLVTFEIVHGRVVARNTRFGQSRGASAKRKEGELRESICLKLRSGVASVHYERCDPQYRLLVSCTARTDFQLQAEPKEDSSPAIVFIQPASGPCELQVGTLEDRQVYRASTLWHLMLGHPAECQEHLIPLLEKLRPNWNLQQQVERLESELIRIAVSQEYPSQQDVWQLVQKMDAKRFQVRQESDRKLRALGLAALGYLENIERNEVNAEQFGRILSIRKSLRVRRPDTAHSVAVWLLGDAEAWDALARRTTPVREAAQRQLERITYRK